MLPYKTSMYECVASASFYECSKSQAAECESLATSVGKEVPATCLLLRIEVH